MAAIYRLIKYASSEKKERDAATSSPMKPGFYGTFPTSFNLYYVGPGEDIQSQHFCLGETPSSKLYAVTFHTGPGFQQMTLYPSTEHASPPLAVVLNEKRYSSSAIVTLPAFSQGADGSTTQNEPLKYSTRSDSYSFGVHIGSGSEKKFENFEWRDDKKTIKPKVRHLVSLGDKVEYLAKWTEGTVPGRDGKLATFRFVNSEATEGLGEYGVLLSVAAALRALQANWAALAGSHERQREIAISYNSSAFERDYSKIPRRTDTTFNTLYNKPQSNEEG